MAPERELIRRISPFALPVAVAAFALGTLLDGTDAGWSAAIAIAVVYLNFVAHGSSLALAASISPTVLYAVGLGGFLDRRLHRRPHPVDDRPARGRDEAALGADAGGPVDGPERAS